MANREEQKNPERVAAGLKATLHNPTVSASAKSRAQARLKDMGVDADTKAPSHKAKEKTTDEAQPHDLRHEEKNVPGYEVLEEHRILGGYKATLKNPNVSQEAKEHAKEVLKEHEVKESEPTEEAQPHDLRHEENVSGYKMPEEHRILGGYKATLKNPNVSQEAKEHAKEVLKEHEAI